MFVPHLFGACLTASYYLYLYYHVAVLHATVVLPVQHYSSVRYWSSDQPQPHNESSDIGT